jgi:hypothetical protein
MGCTVAEIVQSTFGSESNTVSDGPAGPDFLCNPLDGPGPTPLPGAGFLQLGLRSSFVLALGRRPRCSHGIDLGNQ